MKLTDKQFAVVFSFFLLVFTCLVRSEIIVDTSLLPRAFSLAILLLATYVLHMWKKPLFRNSGWLFLLICFYVWNLLSSFWSISGSEAIMQSQLVFLGLAMVGFISHFLNESTEFEHIFIKTLIVLLMISFVMAFFKMSSLQFYDPYKIHPISLNNNLYACFLLLSLALLFHGYELFKSFWKYLCLLTIILTFFFIIIVQSRAAYIGLMFSLFVLSILVIIKYRYVLTLKNILSGVVSLFILAIALVFFYHTLDATRKNAFRSKVAVWEYFMPSVANVKEGIRFNDLSIGDPDSRSADVKNIPVEYFENVNSRLIFWKKSLGLFRQSPVYGVGAGNWRIRVAGVSEPPNPELTTRNFTYSQPHNEWICFLTELGIIGLLLALLIFILPIAAVFFLIVKNHRDIPFTAVILCAFLGGFMIFASFDFPFRRIEHIILLFSVFAFLFHKVPVLNYRLFQKGYVFDVINYAHLFTILVILTGVIVLARLKGEYYTLKIFSNERKNDKAVIRYCHLARNPFYTITPNTLPVDWFEGVAQYRLGRAQDALDCFKSAMHSTPYEVRLLNDYGASLYSLGETRASIAALRQTLKIDPYFDEPKYNLSAIYHEISMPDSALYFVTQCRESQKKSEYLEELTSTVPK
ncbi:MAG: O-antigen ligase family protein [Bacteroidetes bacterium]|nr:O-antigen ligase family protein [Bacteroidota bacterium]